jgi:hypothetical protein
MPDDPIDVRPSCARSSLPVRHVGGAYDGAATAQEKSPRLVRIDDRSIDARCGSVCLEGRQSLRDDRAPKRGLTGCEAVATRSCCDIATKTTAVDKRCDLHDMRLRIAALALSVPAAPAARTRKATGLTLPPGYAHADGALAQARRRISSRRPSGRRVCSRTPFVMSPDVEATRRFAADFASRAIVNCGYAACGFVSSPTVANCRWDPRRCKSRLHRWHL